MILQLNGSVSLQKVNTGEGEIVEVVAYELELAMNVILLSMD